MKVFEKSEKKHSCLTRYVQFLLSTRAVPILSILSFAIILLFQVLKTAMTFLTSVTWQLSGYYLSGLERGLLLFLTVSWLISIIILFLKRQYAQGSLRMLAIPLFLFIYGITSAFITLMLPSRICGWPSDAVYSKSREKYFIISRGPLPIDIYYHVYSTTGTLLNPNWTFEFSTGSLGFSTENSITEDPHLILSEDEELLVMSRGSYLTEAIHIDSNSSMVENIRSLEIRKNQIKSLLQRHSSKSKSEELQAPLTYLQVRTILKEYYQKLGNELTEILKEDGWNVSCELKEVDKDGVKIQADYTVECSKDNKIYYFWRDIRLMDDNGHLIIVEQDNSLSWSDDEEKVLCENVRHAITEISGPGSYIN